MGGGAFEQKAGFIGSIRRNYHRYKYYINLLQDVLNNLYQALEAVRINKATFYSFSDF